MREWVQVRLQPLQRRWERREKGAKQRPERQPKTCFLQCQNACDCLKCVTWQSNIIDQAVAKNNCRLRNDIGTRNSPSSKRPTKTETAWPSFGYISGTSVMPTYADSYPNAVLLGNCPDRFQNGDAREAPSDFMRYHAMAGYNMLTTLKAIVL